MNPIFKSEAAEQAVFARYREMLAKWPVANQHLRIPTCFGETFVVASGPEDAPPVILLHGANGNASMWLPDVRAWAEKLRIYAVDVIGDPGFSAGVRPGLASDAHARWLDDVLKGLKSERAGFVGVSNGGWLALDYARRRPEKVTNVAALCPGGILHARKTLLPKVLPLLLLGPWGAAKAREIILGKMPKDAPATHRAFAEYMGLIFHSVKPRMERHPLLTGEDYRQLTMPVLVILGEKDAIFDSAALRDHLAKVLPSAEVRYVAGAGHHIPGQTIPILEFLLEATTRPRCHDGFRRVTM